MHAFIASTNARTFRDGMRVDGYTAWIPARAERHAGNSRTSRPAATSSRTAAYVPRHTGTRRAPPRSRRISHTGATTRIARRRRAREATHGRERGWRNRSRPPHPSARASRQRAAERPTAGSAVRLSRRRPDRTIDRPADRRIGQDAAHGSRPRDPRAAFTGVLPSARHAHTRASTAPPGTRSVGSSPARPPYRSAQSADPARRPSSSSAEAGCPS